jgi:hypothetical protein
LTDSLVGGHAALPDTGGSTTELSATDAWRMAVTGDVAKVVLVDMDYKGMGTNDHAHLRYINAISS